MENHYQILGVGPDATSAEIKKAFRERAKASHPDIAGPAAEAEMRKILRAYEILSNTDRREEYDRAYHRFMGQHPEFNYRSFLKERGDELSMAVLIFYDFLHLEEDEAIATWDRMGDLDFELENYLDREDWMDCTFILAEELDKRGRSYEAFRLLLELIREERRKPYFKHFFPEVEDLVREIARVRLHASAGDELYLDCLEELLDLGYSRRDEARWLRSMAETLERIGEVAGAKDALRAAIEKDRALPGVESLRRRLGL